MREVPEDFGDIKLSQRRSLQVCTAKTMTEDPPVTLVIVTRNRSDTLKETLKVISRLHLSHPVIVVDNGSTDETCAMVSELFPQVTLVSLGYNAGAAGRNEGVKRASTPLVAFNVDDSLWSPGSLETARELMRAHPEVGLLAACVLVGREGKLDPTCVDMASSPLSQNGLPGKLVLGFLACAGLVRRSAFLECGGFHQQFGVGGEEELLAMDMATRGWKLCYVPMLTVRHWPSPSRDPRQRAILQLRNRLWCAWLRRPWRRACSITYRALVSCRGSDGMEAFHQACRGLPWILKERHCVKPEIESQLRRIERAVHVPARSRTRRDASWPR
jgi:GT2 family glycosyltransferase